MAYSINSFVRRRCAEIRHRYEYLRSIEIAERLAKPRQDKRNRPNEPFWVDPRDYLRIQVYQLTRVCLERGEDWLDALLALAPGAPNIEDFVRDPFRLVVIAAEPSHAAEEARHALLRAKLKLGPGEKLPRVRLSASTRSRMASDLMIAHKSDVPVKFLIGFLRQLGDEPSQKQLGEGRDRALFREDRAVSMQSYFVDVYKEYSAKQSDEAVEPVKAAPIAKSRLRKDHASRKRVGTTMTGKRKARLSIRSIVHRRSRKPAPPDS